MSELHKVVTVVVAQPVHAQNLWLFPSIENTKILIKYLGYLLVRAAPVVHYLYDIPLYVVPTSKARINLRLKPEYFSRRAVILMGEGACRSGEVARPQPYNHKAGTVMIGLVPAGQLMSQKP